MPQSLLQYLAAKHSLSCCKLLKCLQFWRQGHRRYRTGQHKPCTIQLEIGKYGEFVGQKLSGNTT